MKSSLYFCYGYYNYVLFSVIILSLASAVRAGVKDIRNEMVDAEFTHQMATLSRLVYYRDFNATNIQEVIPENYNFIGWIDEGSTEVLVVTTSEGTDDDKVIVIFRGTEEIEDWIANVDIEQVPYGPPNRAPIDFEMYRATSSSEVEPMPILVHRGFSNSLKLYDRVLQLLSSSKMEPKLYVTGHSLGGANAQVFSGYFAYNNPNVSVYCMTFGSPRVGTEGFKLFMESIFNLNLWRVVNNNDIVPRVPSYLQDFSHAGHLLWYRRYVDKEGNLTGASLNAYYRQVGNARRGYKGIPDFSVALITAETANQYVVEHFMKTYLSLFSGLSAVFPVGFVKQEIYV